MFYMNSVNCVINLTLIGYSMNKENGLTDQL